MLVQHGPGRHGLRGGRCCSAQHRRPGGEGWQDHFRGGRLEAYRGMRAYRVVVSPPALDHHLCLTERVEALPPEQLVAQPGVEALNIAVLPRRRARTVAWRLGRPGALTARRSVTHAATCRTRERQGVGPLV